MNPTPYCLEVTPPPEWTATRTYVATCQPPLYGAPVSATRTFTSKICQEHAETMAMWLAKRDAEAGLVCCFKGESSWMSPEGVVETAEVYSCESQEKANNLAIRAAYVKANGIEVSEHEAWLFNYRPVGAALLHPC